MKLRVEEGAGRWGKAVLTYRGRAILFPVDRLTGYVYSADSPPLIRLKGFCLFAGTPPFFLARALWEAARGEPGEALRALGYGVFLTPLAAYAVLSPLRGRVLYGSVERRLNALEAPDRGKGTSFFHLFRACILAAIGGRPYGPRLRRWSRQARGKPLYVATCFQPVARIGSPDAAERLREHRWALYRMGKSFRGLMGRLNPALR